MPTPIEDKEYIISIDPRILELLGPSLYTNIYYVLAELIANAYDANAKNVYIYESSKKITVEDDGNGMSYDKNDVGKYLNVAVETRTSDDEIYVQGSDKKRKKIGRKGIGKLAALAVSNKVFVKTIKEKDKSGFILSRHVNKDHKLEPLSEKEITFEQGEIEHGTSIVMEHPEYKLHKLPEVIKRNVLKMFPHVSKDFKIHIKTEKKPPIIIDAFDTEVIKQLCALITFGDGFKKLGANFSSDIKKEDLDGVELYKVRPTHVIPIDLITKEGKPEHYEMELNGWIGAYATTSERKLDRQDFPDNFISFVSNGKVGEYNVLPHVGKNKLQEVYVVGQLHIDLFEETELPDMALSNRQGYKSDDDRYIAVSKYVSNELLPEIVKMRNSWAKIKRKDKDAAKQLRQKAEEEKLRKDLEKYKNKASEEAAKQIAGKNLVSKKAIKDAIEKEMNRAISLLGLKGKVDSQKKRILLSHASQDSSLADIIFEMLAFNNIPYEDIIYTSSSEHGECRFPEGRDAPGIFDYLRNFFVESVSDKMLYVIYVTSEQMSQSWFAVTEAGAGWITRSSQQIFNIKRDKTYKPDRPLDIDHTWQTSNVDVEGNVSMEKIQFDKFIVKIRTISEDLGYIPRSKSDNITELKRKVRTI